MVASNIIAKPVRGFGGFYAMALDTFVQIFKPPFAWREFISQSWFVARVSIVPTLMLTIPYTVLLTFTFNILLTEFGAADFSGTGAALGTVRQIGPIVTVLVVAGAGATAMCADLGARTIREELDALRVMGVNPIQALVVPRVLAATLVSLALAATVILVGLAGAYLFCVYIQHVSPGAFAAGLDADHRRRRCHDCAVEGSPFRALRRHDRLLQRHFRRRWAGGGRKRGERNRGVHLHGVVRDQCGRDRRRREGENYVPLNDGYNWKGDPNATLSGQPIPQLPPGSPPAQAAAQPAPAPPPIAAAEYDPATGTYVGPDGRVYTQSNLARSATEEQTWQTMLLPPAGN
jgi:phospholipid/cholesterol/gamma-HCH transport system permease protein